MARSATVPNPELPPLSRARACQDDNASSRTGGRRLEVCPDTASWPASVLLVIVTCVIATSCAGRCQAPEIPPHERGGRTGPAAEPVYRLSHLGSVDLSERETVRHVAGLRTATGAAIFLVVATNGPAHPSDVVRIVRVAAAGVASDGPEFRFEAGRVEGPKLFSFRNRILAAAIVDRVPTIFHPGDKATRLKLQLPSEAGFEAPVSLDWLAVAVDADSAVWVGCVVIGVPGGDRICLWRVAEEDLERSDLRATFWTSFPAGSYGALPDLVLDEQGLPRGVLWIVGRQAHPGPTYLTGALHQGGTAAIMSTIDEGQVALNLYRIPRIPCTEVREVSGLSRCVSGPDGLFVAWLSRESDRSPVQLLGKFLPWDGPVPEKAVTVDTGDHPIREFALSRDRSGDVLLTWTIVGQDERGQLMAARLSAVSNSLGIERIVAAESADTASVRTPHLLQCTQGVIIWSVDPELRRVTFRGLDIPQQR